MKLYEKPMLYQESLFIADTAIASSDCYRCINSSSQGGTPTSDVPAGVVPEWTCSGDFKDTYCFQL